jgi:hypothetical protein
MPVFTGSRLAKGALTSLTSAYGEEVWIRL